MQCAGFSLRWLLLLQSTGSRHAGCSSCGTRAQLLHGMWDLPGPGIEPMSPALAGGFLTTAPPGKSLDVLCFSNSPHLTDATCQGRGSILCVMCGYELLWGGLPKPGLGLLLLLSIHILLPRQVQDRPLDLLWLFWKSVSVAAGFKKAPVIAHDY